MAGNLNYIDLFAGCGGLSVGLHKAGWKGLFAVEKNSSAFASLKANLVDKRRHFIWPEWLETQSWDIEKLLKQKSQCLSDLSGTVDLVAGGPPCQGFSTAGRRLESDKRNELVQAYLKVVELVQPRCILFENVRGFTMKFKSNAHEGITYSKLVIQQLRELGYKDARGELINMSDFGVPQARRRFIVIATREGVADQIFESLKQSCPSHLKKRGIPKRNGVSSALSDLQKKHGTVPCPESKGFQSGISSRPMTGLQKHLRHGVKVKTPNSHRFVNHTKEVTKVFNKLLNHAPRNRCILGNERKQYGLKKRSVTVLDGKKSAPTITTIPDDFIHYTEPRVMTVRECARLQT